jgi:D-alanyl-lipoteichoic acid acyltransferase DltB (MBOAT superfamily)
MSFLFFKVIHVVVDSAGGSIGRLTLGRYVNYCTNFTTLLMGPVQRYQDFTEQWDRPEFGRAAFVDKLDGTNRVLRGLLKAFGLAPWLAPYVLQPGANVETAELSGLVLQTYLFYVYLYLEFSGYCDVMIGVGSLMGIRPPENFRFPFLSRNVSAYWLRVHRSLTEWLTDYVFTPIYRAALDWPGPFRYGYVALAASLVLTMVVAGVWHGTTLNFVLFGLVHGVALAVARAYDVVMERWLGRAGFRAFSERWFVTTAAVLLTYNFTSLAYAFFVLDARSALWLVGRLTGLVGV